MKGKLAHIECRLEQLEIKGLEDTEEYHKLQQEADEIVLCIECYNKKKLEESEQRAEARRYEALKLRIGERFADYDVWLKWAMSLYIISQEDGDFILSSRAKNWEKAWVYSSRIDCLEKIEQLIDYKEYDHFVRSRKE